MPGITLDTITNFQNSARAKVRRKTFTETLALTNHSLLQEFIWRNPQTIPAGGTKYEERIRLRANVGATRGVDLYEVTAAQKAPPVAVASAKYVFYENKGIVFDLREDELNSGDESIIRHMDAERSANYEDIALKLENDLATTPLSSSDTKHIMGIPTWIRPSMTSLGAFTADLTGGFNGTYIRYLNGSTASVSATLANIDASSVDSERWRNWCATRPSGDLTLPTCQTIRRGMNATNFKALPMLKGEQKTTDAVVFMSETDHDVYMTLVEAGPDDRNGDVFPFKDFTLGQARIVRTPQFNNDAIRPIYFLRLGLFSLIKVPGRWMKEGKAREKADAHNTVYIPIDIGGQLWCHSPRAAGGVVHGSF
jgi:hypothetical protein